MKSIIEYDSYNARYLSFEEVAETFIINPQYQTLIKNSHSILMGPRGCGKTTLLKMLNPRALKAWQNKDAKKIFDSIPFWAIYIPADSQWKSQLETLQKKFQDKPNLGEDISRALANTNVMIALINTFADLFSIYSQLSNRLKKESELSIELIDIFSLNRPIAPTLFNIKQALISRINDVNILVKKYGDKINRNELKDYFHEDYWSLANQACNAFEYVFRDYPVFNQKFPRWALCFDELEISPFWLQKELLTNLRSRDQRFILKLTTSPLVTLYDEIKEEYFNFEAKDTDDYDIIRNWVYDTSGSESWRNFCNKLTKATIKRKLNSKLSPKELFGNSNISRCLSELEPKKFKEGKNKKDFEKGSPVWSILKEQAQEDKSLYDFLLRSGLNPQDPSTTNPDLRAKTIRKIKPIVIYRYLFRKDDTVRSRKNVAIYFGIPLIYEISDGNPRAFVILLNEVMEKISQKKFVTPLTIAEQSRLIRDFSNKQFEKFINHPEATVVFGGKEYSLERLIENIAEYFWNFLIREEFRSDPIGSIRIDTVPAGYIKLVKQALNLGSFQYMDPREGFTDINLVKKRFRLSYTIHPKYNLPKRDYDSVAFSNVIPTPATLDENQLNIFDKNEN